MNGGATAVVVRARAHDSAAAAGGDARAERRRSLPGAVRRRLGWDGRAGRRGSGGRHSDLPGGRRAVRPRGSRPVDPRRDQLCGVDVRHLHPPGRALGSQQRGAAGPMQIGIGGTAGDTWDTIKVDAPGDPPGQPTNVYDEADAVYSAPTTCTTPARPVTGPARSSPTTTQAPMFSRSSRSPPATTPRA